jgi:hypothetical protein
MIRIAILDDYQNAALEMADWSAAEPSHSQNERAIGLSLSARDKSKRPLANKPPLGVAGIHLQQGQLRLHNVLITKFFPLRAMFCA